jgi:hypothetical protein
VLGDGAYAAAVEINHHFNRIRRLFGFRYWSLSAYLKHKVKRAVEFISHFEQAVVREARRAGADGVVCGHVHTCEMRDIDGIHYCNDGDWVESCTALVEHKDGRLELIHWQPPSHVRAELHAAPSRRLHRDQAGVHRGVRISRGPFLENTGVIAAGRREESA